MKSMSKKLLVALLVVGGAYGVVAAPPLLAQKAETKADAKAPETKKPVNRLPIHFGNLVDGTQKEKIYSIQNQYTPQIEALAEQIKALQAKRDSEVESVLTPEQKAKLEKARADYKAKALERAAAKKAAEAAPAATTAPPAATTTTTPTKSAK